MKKKLNDCKGKVQCAIISKNMGKLIQAARREFQAAHLIWV